MEAIALDEDRLVFVREYLRYRLDKWETVTSHLRKWPCSSKAKSK
jgi:hypothetical protein